MDIQLQELIEKIKKDGIEAASGEAARLKAAAESEAALIIEAAKKEAAGIIERGKADAERDRKAGIAAVEQASRNLILAFKTEIEGLLTKIIARETGKAYDSDVLKAAIPEVVKGWSKAQGGVNVILGEAQLKTLEDWSKQALSAEISRGVELKAGKNIAGGFRIGEKDGSAYYDFSAEAVAELLSAYVNPRLAETLKSAARGI
ncbi:MAG: V-type ATP synthase subunit E [Spirochaetaceae bacterium]|jgi:V/A-type H+-transporting ATPase subunit E|nr:V-type ATP synthase subunit E [Spirochaetaceae bacterium]GMO26641.1 MAG: V-type ATP synthase subunit E [Termitinemataceae bacterium]